MAAEEPVAEAAELGADLVIVDVRDGLFFILFLVVVVVVVVLRPSYRSCIRPQ